MTLDPVASISLNRFLTRLIWLCVGPLVLLAAYLAIADVLTARDEHDLEAAGEAKSFARVIDQHLNARISALRMLAMSPQVDDASRWKDLYQEAQGFHQSFGSHVILADLQMRMLFNTRVPFGATLPLLPRPKGHAAAPAAVETGKPEVGDAFLGPIAGEPLVAIAVPAQREGKTAFLLLTVLTTRQFQEHLDQVALPSGWSLTLLDGKNEVIARRAPPGLNPVTDIDATGRFIVKSTVAPWSVVLEIPRNVYRKPLFAAAAALVILILGATLVSVLGGMLASRRLAKSVASLAESPMPGAPPPDITEIATVRRLLDESAEMRETAEAGRRESEQRFRATFEQAAVGIARVAPDGHWLQANQKFCGIVGYSHDELRTRTFPDITHPDDLDAEFIRMRQMLAGDIETYSVEQRYLHKGGAIVWVNLTVALVWKPDATPDYFIFVIEDIQARKQAEAALKESRAALQVAQRLAGIGNWNWDVRTNVHTWSEEIYLIYGRDPALPPAIYPEVQEYFTPESWARLAAAVEEGLAEGGVYECDAEVVRPDGTHRWIVARGEAMRDADGNVVNLHGTVQDITERKRAEEEIRQLNANLERRVTERTAELSAANRELDAFAYAVSHDLRAPLRAMSGFSQALLEDCGGQLDGEAKVYLEQIDLASRKMSELIDGLLTLSRSTRGRLRHDVVDISGLSQRLLAELARSDPDRQVAVEVEAGLQARGDARMIEVVTGNLLGNAWKYSAHAAAASIRVYSEERDGTRGFCVADTGAGFDMAHAGKLFEPFQRLHRQDEFPGIGIGLATVQRIIHRHGGVIEARGERGKGATFWFTLPGTPTNPPPDDKEA